MRKWTFDVAALALRVGAGLIFIPHGWAKVFGAGGPAAFAQDMTAFGFPVAIGYLAAYAEVFGAVLLIAGLFTRLDALLLACTMFTATFVVQLPDALYGVAPDSNRYFAIMQGIELPLALFAMSLATLLIGPGRISLDQLLKIEARFAALFGKKKAAAEAAA